jgi:large subunit ribosomal protein L4
VPKMMQQTIILTRKIVMKADILNIDTGKAKSITLSDTIFSLQPRKDILSRIVRWQLAKRQQGTHSVKTRSEGSYSKSKIYRQKGTGGARHGDRNAPIFRKGGVYKGPTTRSHSHDINKKLRKLGIRHALSSKVLSGKLVFIEEFKTKFDKTKDLVKILDKYGWHNLLIIDEQESAKGLAKFTSRLSNRDVLSVNGINVYDILRRDHILITSAALKQLEERFQ